MWSSDEFLTLEPFDPITDADAPWSSHDSQHIGPRCTGMKDINQCIALTRISIILGYYKEWIDERFILQQTATKSKDDDTEPEHKADKLDFNDNLIYDFINNVFDQENGYSNVTLLNDFHHLIENHAHQFEDIYDRISKQCYQDILIHIVPKEIIDQRARLVLIRIATINCILCKMIMLKKNAFNKYSIQFIVIISIHYKLTISRAHNKANDRIDGEKGRFIKE